MDEISYLKSVTRAAEDIFQLVAANPLLKRPQYIAEQSRYEHSIKDVPTFLTVSVARLLSLSNVLLLLLEKKFFQEMGIIFRCMDETSSNIGLLIQGLSENEEVRKIQDQLIADFYKYPYEEADTPYPVIAKYTGPQSNQVRKAYLTQSGLDANLEAWEGNIGGLYKLFSKHVHGNYYAAIELYSGKENVYEVNGSSVRELYCSWAEQVPSHIYRTILTCKALAWTFGTPTLADRFAELVQSIVDRHPGIDGLSPKE